MIYLDNCATTMVSSEVADRIHRLLQEEYGNPSSLHIMGRRAQDLLLESRQALAQVIGAKASEIIFNSCATEGNNQVLKNFRGKHIISSVSEHPSVLKTLQAMAKEGTEVTFLPVDERGQISLTDLQKALRKDTALVSIMMVNNETGAIHDLEAISKIIKESGSRAKFHSDCVQGFGKLAIDVKKMGLDYLTISAHKAHGPKGLGALYLRQGLQLDRLLHGGGQEQQMRAGTHNLPYIGAFVPMAQEILAHRSQHFDKVAVMKQELVEFFQALSKTKGIKVQINGDPMKDSPYILNVSFQGLRAQVLLNLLEEKQVCVSTGSACSSKNQADSHVLTAMKLDPAAIKGSVRIGLSDTNTKDDIEKAKAAFHYALDFLGRMK